MVGMVSSWREYFGGEEEGIGGGKGDGDRQVGRDRLTLSREL